MTPQQEKFRAEDAKGILGNPLYKEAWDAVSGYLETKALSCDPDNKEMAQRVVISKQIMAALRREFEAVIQNGAVAEIRIAELEKKKLFSVFRR